MAQHHVKVKSVDFITHDVVQIATEKPPQFNFTPGQATDVSIDKKSWENEKRPFTFTSLPEDDFIQFVIKTYPLRKGLTNELRDLKIDDSLVLHDTFGDIGYKGEGVFIAGGAGVTPFISIFRDLRSKGKIGNNKLIFANKTKADIILHHEFDGMLGDNFINILADEKIKGYAHGMITEDFLRTHIPYTAKVYYLCGPPPMMEAVEKQLANMRVDEKAIVKETF